MEYVGIGLIVYSVYRMLSNMLETMHIGRSNIIMAVFGVIVLYIGFHQNIKNSIEIFESGENVYINGNVISKETGWELKDSYFIKNGKYLKLSFFNFGILD